MGGGRGGRGRWQYLCNTARTSTPLDVDIALRRRANIKSVEREELTARGHDTSATVKGSSSEPDPDMLTSGTTRR